MSTFDTRYRRPGTPPRHSLTEGSPDTLIRPARRPLRLDSLPEQERFFDVQFDFRLGEYIIRAHRKDVPTWFDLQPTSIFMLNTQVFRRGDVVMVEVFKESGPNIARVMEGKRLPKSDKRKLVLINWFYEYRGHYYESNHLQIVLWDTIAGRATKQQMRKIKYGQLYNACGRERRICDRKQRNKWREHKRRILQSTE
jgi:hypothetical protein